MSKRLRFVTIGVTLIAIFAGACWAYNSYNLRYRRPHSIQIELLGRDVSSSGSAISFNYEMTGFGDARFTWEYNLDPDTRRTLSCRRIYQGRCLLAESRSTDREVTISVEGLKLRIDEWWY